MCLYTCTCNCCCAGTCTCSYTMCFGHVHTCVYIHVRYYILFRLLYVSYLGAMASPGPGLSGNQIGGCDGSRTSGLKEMDGNEATHPPEIVVHHRIVLNGTMYKCVCTCVCTCVWFSVSSIDLYIHVCACVCTCVWFSVSLDLYIHVHVIVHTASFSPSLNCFPFTVC